MLNITQRYNALPENAQKTLLDFADFLAVKSGHQTPNENKTMKIDKNITALELLKAPKEQRDAILKEQALSAAEFYKNNPDLIVEDFFDEIIDYK